MFGSFTLLAFASAALGSVVAPMSIDERSAVRRSLSGQATFYGGNVHGGACSFSTYTLPASLKGTALSSSNWDNSGNCGGCVSVHHGGKSVTAMIVDECPGCGSNHLDLFPDAFADLAPKSEGVIPVSWYYVPCPHIEDPLEIHMKPGVSEYWFSAQVVNGHRRTSKMEISTDHGRSWKGTSRTTYNFFEISSGAGAEQAWIRVTR